MQILLQYVYLTFRFFHRLAKSITLTDTEAHSEIQCKNARAMLFPVTAGPYICHRAPYRTHNDGE